MNRVTRERVLGVLADMHGWYSAHPDGFGKRHFAQRQSGDWCYYDRDDVARLCLLGADLRCMQARGYYGLDPSLWQHVASVLQRAVETYTDGRYERVVDFNDADTTTHADALAVIALAAGALSRGQRAPLNLQERVLP